MTQYLFLDTNIYLHAQPFDRIPWPRFTKADRAVIVVPHVTVEELDDKKRTGRTKRIRDRARSSTIKLLEGLENPNQAESQRSVELEEFSTLPQLDMAALNLDRDSNDDLLLASILAYRDQHENRDIALVSSDAGPRLKARRLGIPILPLPEKYVLEPELSDMEKDLREAKAELARVQAAQPNLRLTIGEGADQLVVKPALALPQEHDIKRTVEEHRQQFSLEHLDPQAVVGGVFGKFAASAEEVQHRRGLSRYLEQWERWYRRELSRQIRQSRIVKLDLLLVNNGRKPATDVSVMLDMPSGVEVLTQLQESEPQVEPRPPSMK